MSSRFVLDQSVVYGALEERAEPEQAIHAIISRCDTVVWNAEWYEKCLSVVSREASRDSSGALQLLLLFHRALAWEGKMDQVTGQPSALANATGIHHKDLWLVRLAMAGGATVVAEDAPLREALHARGVPCVTPSEVLGGADRPIPGA
ncbi:MAG: hypothetical protein FJ291_30810 [Planctomycetes bacterium]|nr:hypothetical protein [Planctomycetota bacterium]